VRIVELLRTPEDAFAALPDFPYEPHYADVPDPDGGAPLRMAWVEDGPADGQVVVCLHGEPSWSFLYRTMIPVLAGAGHRVIAPDLIGFGRSDKPAEIVDHSYARHVEWMRTLLFDVLELREVTLVGQDWGGLIGLRVLAENTDRFARLVVANTALPTGDHPMPESWHAFRKAMQTAPVIDIGRFVRAGCKRPLSHEARAGYDAPFPTREYQAGARAMPGLVPYTPDDPASEANRAAWGVITTLNIPALVAFSDGDPIMAAMRPIFEAVLPGAKGREHPVIENAGHFLQEDDGPTLAAHVNDFIAATPLG
jgi:haloalkane dehalogenase